MARMELGWRLALLALLLGLGGGSRAQEQLPRESHNLNWVKVSLAPRSPCRALGPGWVGAVGRGPLKPGTGWQGAWALASAGPEGLFWGRAGASKLNCRLWSGAPRQVLPGQPEVPMGGGEAE